MQRHGLDRVALALVGLTVLVLASGCALWVSASHDIRGLDLSRDTDDRVALVARDIAQLAEVRTHSAARYAFTGDQVWRIRYDDAAVRVDQAITASRELGGPEATDALDEIDDANRRLMSLETRIFSRQETDRPDEASLLLSGGYGVQKARYLDGLATFVEQQQVASDASSARQRHALIVNRFVAAGLVLVLLLSVIGLWRVYRRQSAMVGDHVLGLHTQARTDVLTGLPNRRAALDLLDALVARSAAGHPGSVLFIDLDGFKSVNDTFGHAAGDDVLVESARRLLAVIADDGEVVRLGGDEFLVLLDRDLDGATAIAGECLTAMREPFVLDCAVARLSASIGMAQAAGSSAVELLADADFATTWAKDQGTSQTHAFDPHMRQRIVERHRLEGDIRAALVAGEFEVHYQPVVAIDPRRDGHRVIGAEALVRWRRPDGSLVLPGGFLPVAEASSLIIDIDRLVLSAACRQLALWRADGLALCMAVNISGRHVLHGELVGDVRAVLADGAIDPRWLTLELTETQLLPDVARAAAVLGEVRQLGVRIALDDFTTGYSTLTHLTTLPADVIKIDRSFVAGIAAAREHLLVEYLLRLAHLTGLDVIAEGVETPQQLAALDALGCHTAQGFLFQPALSAADFGRWVVEQRGKFEAAAAATARLSAQRRERPRVG